MGSIMGMDKSGFGLDEGPCLWFSKVESDLISGDYTQNALDKAVFTYHMDLGETDTLQAIMLVFVDDLRVYYTDWFDKHKLKELQGLYKLSEWSYGNYKYVGSHYEHHDGKLTVSMDDFVKKLYPVEKSEMKDLVDYKTEERKLTEAGTTRFRGVLGGLQWLIKQGRPDLAGEKALLANELSHMTKKSLKEANRVISLAKETNASKLVTVPIPLDEPVVVAFGDSAWNNLTGGKSQGGVLVLATNGDFLQHKTAPTSILDWRTRKSQRVCQSTLQAETYIAAEGLSAAMWTRELLRSIIYADYKVRQALTPQGPYKFPVAQVTDCASLYDCVKKDTAWAKEERTRLSVLVIKEDLRDPDTSFRWSPTHLQLADGLTKSNSQLCEHIRRVMAGSWEWSESTEAEIKEKVKAEEASAKQEYIIAAQRAKKLKLAKLPNAIQQVKIAYNFCAMGYMTNRENSSVPSAPRKNTPLGSGVVKQIVEHATEVSIQSKQEREKHRSGSFWEYCMGCFPYDLADFIHLSFVEMPLHLLSYL